MREKILMLDIGGIVTISSSVYDVPVHTVKRIAGNKYELDGKEVYRATKCIDLIFEEIYNTLMYSRED